jgi:hypothetical protein
MMPVSFLASSDLTKKNKARKETGINRVHKTKKNKARKETDIIGGYTRQRKTKQEKKLAS